MAGGLKVPCLQLLGGFALTVGGRGVDVPAPGRRLVAFLALRTRPWSRALVAGALWPETTDLKAGANLRTTLWRLHDQGIDLVDASSTSLGLSSCVDVDTRRLEGTAAALAAGTPEFDPATVDPATLAGELLPEMWDPWLVFERERLRQVALHALEGLSRALSRLGAHEAAVLAGLAAVAAEPLRETANRALVEAHLAEGNAGEAVRQYRRYAALLRSELGLEPQASFRRLLEPARAGTVAVR